MRSWLRCSGLLASIFGVPARAEPPLPSYTEEVVVAAWTELDAAITDACTPAPGAGAEGQLADLCDGARLLRIVDEAQRFLDRVVPDGRIRYLQGLAHRHRGDLSAAETALRDATLRAPDRPEAWLDLGEILASRRDHDGARAAFEQVVRIVPDGSRAWPGWFQLAQTDAHQRRPEDLERHLREALRTGFSFRLVATSEVWRGFYRDPELRPVLERLVTVYADPETRAQLDAP